MEIKTNSYHLENSPEIIGIFNIFSSSFENLDKYGRVEIFEFLEVFSPERKDMLKNIFSKLNFNYKKLLVDLSMPSNVLGYFSPLDDSIALNPLYLLTADEPSLSAVIFHEGLHAGAYGQKIDDESLVQTLTEKHIFEIYGVRVGSGYDELVLQGREMFGDLSYKEIFDLIESEDEDTFDNLLEILVLKPLIAEDKLNEMSWFNIQDRLEKKWEFLQKLFPRMMNKIGDRYKDARQTTGFKLSEFKLEGLIKKASEAFLKDDGKRLSELIQMLIKDSNQMLLQEEVIENLVSEGFLYLYDTNKDLVELAVDLALIQHNTEVIHTTTENLKLS